MTKSASLEAELKEAETAIETHLEKIEELEQKLFELGGEIGAGRHVPPGVRILSFRDNPAQQEVDLRQATLDRLKSENEALLERLSTLEPSTGGNAGGDYVPKESWDVLKTEKAELVAASEHKDKRIKRLQEVCFGFSSLKISLPIFFVDLCQEECRVPRSYCIHPRIQTCVQPKRNRAHDQHIRPQCRFCFQTIRGQRDVNTACGPR